MQKLEISYNPLVSNAIEKAVQKANDSKAGRDIIWWAMQVISYSNNDDEPQVFSDAWSCPDEEK